MLDQAYNTVEMPGAVLDTIEKRQAPAVHTLRYRASLRGGFALGCQMDEKECVHCGQVKDLGDFYKNKKAKDGLASWCRVCTDTFAAAYRKSHPERVKETQRQRHIRWRAENPEKRRANKAVRRAIKSGKLVRPDKCEDCGGLPPIEAHHDDYSKVLDVDWLCRRCHVGRHKK